jgi:hypothetical protein
VAYEIVSGWLYLNRSVVLRDGYIDLEKLEYFGRQENNAVILQP